MKNKVLTKERMQELQELGISTKSASLFEDPNYGTISTSQYSNHYIHKYDDENIGIPVFTLQDILEMLPNVIEWKGKTYWFSIYVNAFRNKMIGYRDLDLWPINFKSFTIDGAFEILKWCKQYEFI